MQTGVGLKLTLEMYGNENGGTDKSEQRKNQKWKNLCGEMLKAPSLESFKTKLQRAWKHLL